jgi:hypothetical protein
LAQVALLPFGAEEHSEHVSVYEETTHLSTTTYGSGGAAVATAVPVSLGKAL